MTSQVRLSVYYGGKEHGTPELCDSLVMEEGNLLSHFSMLHGPGLEIFSCGCSFLDLEGSTGIALRLRHPADLSPLGDFCSVKI